MLAIAGLLAVRIIFVFMEYALPRLQEDLIKERVREGKANAEMVLQMIAPDSLSLCAAKMGNCLTTLLLGGGIALWSGYALVSSALSHTLTVTYGMWVVGIVMLMVLVIEAALLVLLSDLLPMAMMRKDEEKMAFFAVRPFYIFQKIGYPIHVIVRQMAIACLPLLGIKRSELQNVTHSEEELRMLVTAGQRDGVLNEMESEIIDNVFDFSDLTAREIMIPRQEMICLYEEDSYEDNLKVIMDTKHTRYPLCAEDKDHVIGMVHLRDVLELELTAQADKDLRAIMREILMVHEGMALTDILTMMRKKRIHMAAVADEYGGIAGFLAMEDLLEEIVGDIQDEHDDEAAEIESVEQGVYEFDGKVLLDEVTELLAIVLDEHEEDTIGGYVFGLLGRRPKKGDAVTIGNYRFTVLEVNGFRIVRLKATPIIKEEAVAEEVAG